MTVDLKVYQFATTWYELRYGDIRPFTVVRETEKCLFYLDKYSRGPVRRNKDRNLFRSELEARTELIKRIRAYIEHYEQQLAKQLERLAQLEAL